MSSENSGNSGNSLLAKDFTLRRIGGVDHIILTRDEEWQKLGKLDEKLWMALSCPTKGLEFDADTLALLDTDGDGRIRAKEVKEAVAWLCERLEHPSILTQPKENVDPEDLRKDTEAGESLRRALGLVMSKNGEDKSANLKEIDQVIAEASSYPFNGDGVVPADSAPANPAAPDTGTRAFILKGMAIAGAMQDASGKPGLDANLAGSLAEMLKKFRDWRAALRKAKMPLGENTAEAWTLLTRLSPKLDEYFCLCRLASYAPDALTRINDEAIGQNIFNMAAQGNEDGFIQRDKLLDLPLAKITTSGILNLTDGINPAWIDEVSLFGALFGPMLENQGKSLSEENWKAIRNEFAEYADILQNKPEYALPPANAEAVELPGLPQLFLAPANDALGRHYLPATPGQTLDAMTDAQIDDMLAQMDSFSALVEKDLAAPPLASFRDLRKLALFQEHIYVFLMNFLSFLNFYEPGKKAIFQTGALYLDSRECLLCVPVDDVAAHATLAAPSHLCLVYCAITRKNTDGSESTGTIAAALTMGQVSTLTDGRHGLFVDNEGLEWDSRIVRIVHNPISIREAIWAPYLRISTMIGEQAQKFVASKAKSASDAASNAVSSVATPPKDAPAKQPFDFAKGAGIFAALSVAVSVLSAAFAYIANSLVSLGWWWPVALIVIFLCISGPSALIAWFKLRKRNLGPLLDASGWAINKGAPINLVMGAALTTVGRLPANALRSMDDPYSLPALIRAKKRKAWFWIILLLLILAAMGGFMLYCKFMGEPLWFFTFRAMLGI